MKRILIAATAAAFATQANAGIQTISMYENGALPATVTTSGVAVVSGTQGYSGVTGATNGKTFGTDFIQMANGTSSVTFALTGLAAHSSISLDFLLGAVDSLDGTANDGVGPDYFSVSIDLDGNGSTETSLWNYAYLNCDRVNGVQNAPAGGQLTYRDALFNTFNEDSCFRDSAYDMGVQSAFQNIAHTLSTLTVTFGVNGLQDIGDESYAIDALSVTLNGTEEVPEPAMLGLFGLGAIGLGLARRRRG